MKTQQENYEEQAMLRLHKEIPMPNETCYEILYAYMSDETIEVYDIANGIWVRCPKHSRYGFKFDTHLYRVRREPRILDVSIGETNNILDAVLVNKPGNNPLHTYFKEIIDEE